jgi:hypothetical protein
MDIPEIKRIDLTAEEAKLCQQMEDEFAKGGGYKGEHALWLFRSLYSRKAIPEVRLEQITKPQPGHRSGKSYIDRMQAHGNSIHDVAKDWSFVDHLRYFINGPALPSSTIEGFRKIIIEDVGTSTMLLARLRKFVREQTRHLYLQRSKARDEFWKLAKEADYRIPESIREAAGSAFR